MIAPSFDQIVAAADRLAPVTQPTPLLPSHPLSEHHECSVVLKCENLQRTGSFKFRGAYNALSLLDDAERSAGVVAMSSGNHAQGVAEAGRLLGVQCHIVMPDDAPDVKIARTRGSGAELTFYSRAHEDREAVTKALLSRVGGHFVHPFDDPHIVAGQGTVGLEICQQLTSQGQTPDILLVCTGGGGLTAGIVLACQTLAPQARIYTVEPDGFDDYRRSVTTGTMVTNTQTTGSICDAILTPRPGDLSLEMCRSHLAGGLSVSDAEAMAAMRYAYHTHRIVLEPGGAVALAALTSGALLEVEPDLSGRTIAVVLSGGNVSETILQRALAEPDH